MKATYDKIEVEKDSSKLYSYTRQLIGWKSSGAPTSFNVGGVTISKQNDLANIQAKYYFDKILTIKSKLPLVRTDPLKYLKLAFEQWVPPGRIPTFSVKNVTEGEVVEMLKNHKNSHAYGHDEIDAASQISQDSFGRTNCASNKSVPGDQLICTEVESGMNFAAQKIGGK